MVNGTFDGNLIYRKKHNNPANEQKKNIYRITRDRDEKRNKKNNLNQTNLSKIQFLNTFIHVLMVVAFVFLHCFVLLC